MRSLCPLALSAFVVVVASLSAAWTSVSAQSVSVAFSVVAPNSSFPPREWPACASVTTNRATNATSLYVFGGINIVGSTYGSWTTQYLNDVWRSQDFGITWQQVTAHAPWVPQGWTGAVWNSTSFVFIGAGNDTAALENNEVWSSTDGATWSFIRNAPYAPRENPGVSSIPGTGTMMVALGNIPTQYVDDIWLSKDSGYTWTQQCGNQTSGRPCPFLDQVSPTAIGALHGPALIGLSGGGVNGTWVLCGGYGSNATKSPDFLSNLVAFSFDGFYTWTTYAAPWPARSQARIVVDSSNAVFLEGGLAQVPGVSSVYFRYYSDVWYSPNPASTAAVWVQLTGVNLGSAGYPGIPFSGNPNPAPASFYTDGAILNPCLALRQLGTTRQLALYAGAYAGYTSNNVSVIPVAWPAVFVGNVSFAATTVGAFGDPQLYGLRGQSFQVHGIDGSVYSLISAHNMQLNSRFAFIARADCPAKQVVDTACWSHPGSYMRDMAVTALLDGDEDGQQPTLTTFTFLSGPAATGFQAVLVDGVAANSFSARGYTLRTASTHSVSLLTPLFALQLDNSDGFINLRLQLAPTVTVDQLAAQNVHGLLGQTHTLRRHAGPVHAIEGDVDDYVIADNELTGSHFPFNRFRGSAGTMGAGTE